MKKLLIGCLAMMAFSASPYASVQLGVYSGMTKQGENCNLTVAKEYGTYSFIITWYEGQHTKSCGFLAKKIKKASNSITASGGSDFSVCKTLITLNRQGTPISAKMGIGNFIQLGHDVRCFDLMLDQK